MDIKWRGEGEKLVVKRKGRRERKAVVVRIKRTPS